MNTQLIILTGAGASIPVGIPGMVGMAEAFSDEIAGGTPQRKGFDALLDFGAGTDVEELLQLANAICNYPHDHLSKFIDNCFRAAGDNPTALAAFNRRRNTVVSHVGAFRSHLLDWITQKCLEFDRDAANRIYGDIVGALVNGDTTVFTTNYDGVLDHVAEERGIAVSDNFRQKGRRFYWDPSLASFENPGLRIVRIHGSIHWHASPDGLIERLDPPTNRNSKGEVLERLLIVPTKFKDIYQRNFFPLYTRFLGALGQASTLIVIGHSLRDEYLLAAIRDRLRDPGFRLIIIDPVSPAGSELTGGVRKSEPQVVHLKGGVEDFLPLLLQLIREPDPPRVFELARGAARLRKRIRKPKINIENLPTWVDGGSIQRIKIEVQTAVGGVLLEAQMEFDAGSNQLNDLTDRVRRTFPNNGRFDGFHQITRTFPYRIPKSISKGPHVFHVQLVDDSGAVVARAKRQFKLRGKQRETATN